MVDSERPKLVAGYPKTGRTWVRFMLANTLALQAGLDVEIDLNNFYSLVPNDERGAMNGQPNFAYNSILPKVVMTHMKYDYALHEEADKVFLIRDPRDVVVSHWLHNTNQAKNYNGSLPRFVREPELGIRGFLSHLESWAPHLGEVAILTYEQLRLNPVAGMAITVDALGLRADSQTIASAVDLSSLERMRNLEVTRGIAGHDYNRENPEALRVRRGIVGGFADYLSSDDLQYIAGAIESSSEEALDLINLTAYSLG